MAKIKSSVELYDEIMAELSRENQRNIDKMQDKIMNAIKNGLRETSFILETNTPSKLDFNAVNLIEDNGLEDVKKMFLEAGYVVSQEEQFFERKNDVPDSYKKLVVRW